LRGACYINEFRSLAETSHGRRAIERGNLPPFIDASCRREPDLESQYPSITALCREGHFAPHLDEGDWVAYMTKNLSYPDQAKSARRLVAVLCIRKTWRSPEGRLGTEAHQQAAEWYRQQGLPLPSNCMVNGSQPLPLEFTDRYQSDLRDWEAHYLKVARAHGVFHACEVIFRDVINPPRLTNQQLVEWFGSIPNPREIDPLEPTAFTKMLTWLAVQAVDSAKQCRATLAKSPLDQGVSAELQQ
jgi:hypothetical protein